MNNVEDNRELMTVLNEGSMPKLLREAFQIQNECMDYNVLTKRLHVTDSPFEIEYPTEGDDFYSTLRQLMSPFAFSQLCTKIGVPVRYMNKCYDSDMNSLVSTNMNKWLSQVPEGRNTLVRTHDNRVRGFVSDKFSLLDTPYILSEVDKVVDTVNDYKVKSYFMNEERLHLRLIQREMLDISGEDLFAGIQIDSSDVGRSTLIVQFFIFKQVCTNGLVVPKESSIIFKQRHVGITQEEFRMNLSEGLNRVPLLIKEHMYNIENARMVNYTKDSIEKKLVLVKEDIALADNHIIKLTDLVNNTYGRTKWGLVNAVTDLAKDFTLERRIELERYAGKLLIA